MFALFQTRSSSSDQVFMSVLELRDLAALAGVGGALSATGGRMELGRPVAGGLISVVAAKYGETLGAEVGDGVAWPGGGVRCPQLGAALGFAGARQGVATGALASVFACATT